MKNEFFELNCTINNNHKNKLTLKIPKDRIRQVLASGCDTVDCVAEAINLISTLDYTYNFFAGNYNL